MVWQQERSVAVCVAIGAGRGHDSSLVNGQARLSAVSQKTNLTMVSNQQKALDLANSGWGYSGQVPDQKCGCSSLWLPEVPELAASLTRC